LGLAPAPAAGKTAGAPLLVYTSDWSGQSQIYVAGAQGGPVRGQLTFAPGGAHDPVPSPDGRHMLYRSERSVQQQSTSVVLESLWVIRADGSFPRQLWEGGPGGRIDGVAWSPDSSRLAYLADGKVRVSRADGSGVRVVGSAASGCGLPVWSRDSRRLSAVCRDGILSPDGRWNARARRELLPSGVWISHVTVEDARGSSRPRLTRAGSSPAWSPDSRWLAYVGDNGISIMDPRTGRERVLTRDRGFALAWSPDGTRLAYLRGNGPGSGILGALTGDLRTVSLSGRPHVAVSSTRAYGGTMFSFAWTRQPRDLAYPLVAPTDGLYTGWPVTLLAADGGRVAFATCAGVSVWDPPSSGATDAFDVPEARRCDPDGYSYNVVSLALADNQVAYTMAYGGNTLVWAVGSTSLGPTLQRYQLADGSQTCCLPLPPDVAGEGGLLVFDPYATSFGVAPHGPEGIRRIGPTGCPCPLLSEFQSSSRDEVHLDDVDGNRIVVERPDYLRILGGDGSTLLALSVQSPEAALSGDDLVVHVGGELRDYDATTGALKRSWEPRGLTPPAPQPRRDVAHPTLQDAARGLTAYALDGRIHLLRLTDGEDAVVGAGTIARFMDAGLVYADGARIHLVPYDRLPLS